MFQLFRAIADRLKALFAADVGLDFEAQFVARDAERKAELLRQAGRYEGEGLHAVAQELRRRAEGISLQQPLASVLPCLEHWQVGTPVAPPPAPEDARAALPDGAARCLPSSPPGKKKAR